jgi:hypothetical protein
MKLKCQKNTKLKTCPVHGDTVVFCKEHSYVQYCEKCEIECFVCQPYEDLRKVLKNKKRYFTMSRTRAARIQEDNPENVNEKL